MPPPSDAHSFTPSRTQQTGSTTSPSSQRHDSGSPTKARFGFTKSAGFKPIGQTSSSVKMFFPQDDEESEGRRSPSHTESPARAEIPTKRSRTDISTERGEDDREPTPRFVSVQQDEVPWQSKEAGIEPQPPPSPTLRDATKAPLSPIHARSGDIVPSPGLQPRLPEQEADGITRPSSPTTSRKELYVIVSQVGEGTFGKVYKARNTITNVHVALKRIRMEAERDGFPVTAMREIKLLQSLRHRNVVRLYEMMVSNGSVFMVFEYMDHDLTGVLSQTQFTFSEANLKSLCSQMLAGLAYLHRKGVIHRDIKGSNILINNRGELKLADFGLARFYQKRRRSDYTNRVITLWYRPPELLFGATVYGPEVDMWSAGCIMLELFTKKPVFQGNDEIHQLEVIYRIFGTPTVDRWPGITELPWYELVKPKEVIPDHFRELFQRWLSPAALDLAEQLLTYDPARRVTALQALEAPYFTVEQPPPELPVGLSSLEGEWHELETKRERAKKRRKLENSLQQHVA
ncbi:Pkinase-domain-containing protein [Scleroderma citrinum]